MNVIAPASRTRISGAKLLRDLDEHEFSANYGCDRFTAALLANRFRYIIAHMSTKLQSNAFSMVIRDMSDFCATISGPPEIGWPMPAASLSNPIHWGPVPDSVRVVLEEYGLEKLRPGDLLIANDSYRTGKHLNDMSFIKPLFWEGSLVGAVHITAHQLDLGSRLAGGFDMGSRSLFEDGLVLPPMLLYREGKPERSVFNLIATNSRFPELLLPDFEVINASLALGEQLVMESVGKYGLDAYLGAMRYACDAAAEAMRSAIERLPDGVYESEEVLDGDSLPDSPEYVVKLRAVKKGPHLELDFSGTSHMSRTAFNSSWIDIKTGILVALKMLLDPKSTPTSGTLRGIDILLPPGTVINPYPPAATMFYPELVTAVLHAILHAFNPVLGNRAVAPDCWSILVSHAHGATEAGEPWVSLAVASSIISQPWGGSADGDGDNNTLQPWMNFPDSGVEVREMMIPMVVTRNEILPDTAGPGFNRGGAASAIDRYWTHPGWHHAFAVHVKRAPGGVGGGGSGALGGGWLFDPARTGLAKNELIPHRSRGDFYRSAVALAGVVDPGTHELDQAGEYVFLEREVAASAGTTFRTIGNAAGGWGDPYDRDPERVRRDVRDEYVTTEGAARDYGVVILGDPLNDPENLRVDLPATAKLRLAKRRMA